MLNLQELASQESLQNAIENSKKVSQNSDNKLNLSNKTVFNSTIYSVKKQTVTETAKIDFALCLLSSVADSFHESQVLQLLQVVDCKRKTVAKHVIDKRAVYADFLTVDSDKIFTVKNRSFFENVVSMSEFKQQLAKHAVKLFALLDSENVDFAQAHLINTDIEQAFLMNDNFNAATTKAAKKKAIK